MIALRDAIEAGFVSFSDVTGEFKQSLAKYLEFRFSSLIRSTGEPYTEYIAGLLSFLTDMSVDHQTLLAGAVWPVLCVEESAHIELEKLFGFEVAELARRVKRIADLKVKSDEKVQMEHLRRLILILAKDIRVVFIQLAHCSHQLKVMSLYPTLNFKEDALEARELYAPLANRLGIGRIKFLLEDLSLRILEPDIYSDLKKKIDSRSEDRQLYLEEVKQILIKKLAEECIQADIKGRLKHIDSIYRKMQKQNITFDEVYDIVGIRVIAKNVKDCYSVLGIVHSLWKPIPQRFKDYIAVPKKNNYQSIHTSVIGPSAFPLEIQIRTAEMDQIAEIGIAAHWRYKEKMTGRNYDEKFAWLHDILEMVSDKREPSEVIALLKMDLFPDDVYVFTPQGHVKCLPRNSTVIDFAFLIHTDVGCHCTGAKVNGRLVPLRTSLENGDVVEILTSKSASPRMDWLKFVKTSAAKSKIRKYLKEQGRGRAVAEGKAIFVRQLRKHKLNINMIFESNEFDAVIREMKFGCAEDLMASLGFGETSLHQLLKRITVKLASKEKKDAVAKTHDLKPHEKRVIIGKEIDLMFHFARCCEPLPGEKIIGFITYGRGITIHSARCSNITKLPEERLLKAEWEAGDNPGYPVKFVYEGHQLPDLQIQINRILKDNDVTILKSKVTVPKKTRNRVKGEIVIEITDKDKIDHLFDLIRNVPGIITVSRLRTH